MKRGDTGAAAGLVSSSRGKAVALRGLLGVLSSVPWNANDCNAREQPMHQSKEAHSTCCSAKPKQALVPDEVHAQSHAAQRR